MRPAGTCRNSVSMCPRAFDLAPTGGGAAEVSPALAVAPHGVGSLPRPLARAYSAAIARAALTAFKS
jgi:hypothetical protein